MQSSQDVTRLPLAVTECSRGPPYSKHVHITTNYPQAVGVRGGLLHTGTVAVVTPTDFERQSP